MARYLGAEEILEDLTQPNPTKPPPPTAEERVKKTYAAAATSGGQWTVVEKRKRTPKRPSERIRRLDQRCFELPRDLSRPSSMGGGSISEDLARRNGSV